MDVTALAERLRRRFPDALEARGEITITVAPEELRETLGYLREEGDLAFGFLSDLTASDWPGMNPRFWLAYQLLSMEHRRQVRVKVGLPPDPDPPRIASTTELFPAANWLEREVFDFFGIVFEGH